MRKIIVILLILLALTGAALEICPPMPEGLIPAVVEKVVDGDTIWAQVVEDGIPVTHKVRMLIVDTPETVHPQKGEEPGGIEASEYTRQMLDGKTVYLEYDKEKTDVYGRQLCHVWLEDGTLFTLHLVERGYGQMKIYPPNIKYQKFFVAAQQYAKENELGIWEQRLRIHDLVGVRPSQEFTVETEDGPVIYMFDPSGSLFYKQGYTWRPATADELIYIVNFPERVINSNRSK